MAMDTNRTFEFRGTYTQKDMDALAGFMVALLLDKRIAQATLGAAGIVAVVSISLRSWFLAMSGILAVIGLSMLLRYLVLPWRLLGKLRRNPGPERTISLDRNGVRHFVLGKEQVLDRSALKKAVLSKNHLFLFFNPEGLLMLPLAWITPVASIEDVAFLLARRDDEPAA